MDFIRTGERMMTDKEYNEFLKELQKTIQEGSMKIVDRLTSDKPVMELLTILCDKVDGYEEMRDLDRETIEQSIMLASMANYLFFLEASEGDNG